MSPPELVNMFSVPFAFSTHPDHTRLNPLLKKVVLEMERSGKAANPRPFTQRNATLFESHFDLFRNKDPAIQELKGFCWDQMMSFIGQLNSYDLAKLKTIQIYNDCWFHITRRGGFFGLHNHPNASWSGVYCVDPGRHDPGNKDSGALCFVNPMTFGGMHLDVAVANMKLPWACQGANMQLDPGQLVLFPSSIMHDVKPFEGEGERITIAFNCWFGVSGQT